MRHTIFVLLGLAFAPPSTAQPAPVVDSVGAVLSEGHEGSVVIGLLDGGHTAVHGFGRVDRTSRRPTARTMFEIGSVTKTVTGLLLADAIERDVVEASTPVRALLPDSVAWTYADSVAGAPPTMTLAHLATHRSGLPRLPTNLNAAARPADPYAAYGDSALYAFLDGYTVPRPPGARYVYSNLGMGLLGHLLARRADTTYAALVRRRVAAPLGLSDTRVYLSADQQRRFVQGHNRAGAPTSAWHFEALAGAGALRSTARDLLAYLRAHRRALAAAPDTASARTRAMVRALRPGASGPQADTRLGFAWHITLHDGRPVAWHSGGTGGFRSFVGLDRETGHGAVVLVGTAVSSRAVIENGLRLLEALRSR
jgi:CubicO group peptidase (beta-lactamase class C family)